MNIKKNGICKTIRDIVICNTGMGESLLLNDDKDYKIKDAQRVIKAMLQADTVTNVSDYDVDGITSAYIIKKLGKYLGITVNTRLPRRFSEGFGLSMAAIDEIDSGLLITTDNGISAIEPVHKAKEKGLTVVITDHHLSDGVLPDADLIIDPAVSKKGVDFEGYCGAGIAYKIAELVIEGDLLKELTIIAAIGTIADAVPLIKDNRKIVKKGINYIREGYSPMGLKVLLKNLLIDEEHISAEDIAFKVAPAFNAPGRLRDDGANLALNLLLSTDKEEANALAEEIISLNELRKELVEVAMSNTKSIIKSEGEVFSNPLIVVDDMPEGIVGIVAGQLAESYNRPTFILVKDKDGNYKGSARSPKGYHLKEMLDNVSDTLIRYGGHAEAAGLTVDKDKLEEFKAGLKEQCSDRVLNAPCIGYDLEVSVEDIREVAEELEKYAPYGEGNKAPVFYIRNYNLVPDRKGEAFKYLGKNQKVLRLNGENDSSVIVFNNAAKYEEEGCPECISVVGTMKLNYWNGFVYPQLQAHDYEGAPSEALSLEESIKNKLSFLRMELEKKSV